jgi:hypothetical protein
LPWWTIALCIAGREETRGAGEAGRVSQLTAVHSNRKPDIGERQADRRIDVLLSPYGLMPVLDRHLTGDDGRSALVAIVDDFEEIATLLAGAGSEARGPPIGLVAAPLLIVKDAHHSTASPRRGAAVDKPVKSGGFFGPSPADPGHQESSGPEFFLLLGELIVVLSDAEEHMPRPGLASLRPAPAPPRHASANIRDRTTEAAKRRSSRYYRLRLRQYATASGLYARVIAALL